MDYLESAREHFSKDLFATKAAGIVIDAAEPGYSRCHLDITDIHMNAAGTVMGGAVFTLADFAVAIASNTGSSLAVSIVGQISFLAIAKGKQLIAQCRSVKTGRSICYYVTEVYDDLSNHVATVNMTTFRKG